MAASAPKEKFDSEYSLHVVDSMYLGEAGYSSGLHIPGALSLDRRHKREQQKEKVVSEAVVGDCFEESEEID